MPHELTGVCQHRRGAEPPWFPTGTTTRRWRRWHGRSPRWLASAATGSAPVSSVDGHRLW